MVIITKSLQDKCIKQHKRELRFLQQAERPAVFYELTSAVGQGFQLAYLSVKNPEFGVCAK